MSDANPHGIKPGQKLWFVPRRGLYPAETITVSDVGARSAGIVGFVSGCRLRLDNLEVVVTPGGYLHGRCYIDIIDIPSREAGVAADAEWAGLAERLGSPRPVNVTAANIREAARLLGLEDAS